MPERRGAWTGWLVLLLSAVLAGGFAYLNSAERVSLHLGLFVLFRVPLALLLFLVFLLGMGTMFLIGLRHDLRVRRLLREYRIQEERRPWETHAPTGAFGAAAAPRPPPGPPEPAEPAPRWDDLTRVDSPGIGPAPDEGPPRQPASHDQRPDGGEEVVETDLASPWPEETRRGTDRPDAPPV